MKDDGHGPKYGCNYQKCGKYDRRSCPFVKDKTPPELTPDVSSQLPEAPKLTEHERELWERDVQIAALRVQLSEARRAEQRIRQLADLLRELLDSA